MLASSTIEGTVPHSGNVYKGTLNKLEIFRITRRFNWRYLRSQEDSIEDI